MSGCEQSFDAGEFMGRLAAAAGARRVPLQGGMDLTQRCNLRCKHCYSWSASAGGASECSTDEIKSIIVGAVRAGCLFFLLTGGEPLLRHDFAELYRYARTSGLMVPVFTNGTLVDDAIVSLFSELPPFSVEVSLYGVSDSVHDGITGVEGSRIRTMEGVRRLINAGFRVILKSMVMAENIHEVPLVEKLAGELGVKYRMDSIMMPRLDGDMSPVGLGAAASQAVAVEMSDPGRRAQWVRSLAQPSLACADRRYECGAGIVSFHVSASGMLHPCLVARQEGYNLMNGSFEFGWRSAIAGAVSGSRSAGSSRCADCKVRAACSFCPAALDLDPGNRYMSYVCKVAEERASVLSGCQPGEPSA